MFERILVAVDGSPHSARAVRAASDLASLSGGEVRVVHLREYSAGSGGRSAPVPNEARDDADALVDGFVAELTAASLRATGVVRGGLAGHVAREILEEGDDWGASVIVVATRGLSDLVGLVVGSTTHKVLHLGHFPVLVIR